MREPRFIELHRLDSAALAAEVVSGLTAVRAHVGPKFFYDALGSRLFDAITELDEYYPTRTEAAIMLRHGQAIAQAMRAAAGSGAALVDLGAGSGEKAARLFAPLQCSRYVALDISVDYLRTALNGLQQRHPDVEMVGVGLDFSAGLELPGGIVEGAALLHYPGSSIGNFSPEQALSLLRQVRRVCGGGALLIGVDLAKPTSVLQPAYDDALGVTAAFNLNLLRHLNRLIGSDFDPRQWRHVALVDERAGRVEMHLQARCELSVSWPGGVRRFAPGERIHTENSYKWQRSDFESLLREAGFGSVQVWSDDKGWFAVMLAAV